MIKDSFKNLNDSELIQLFQAGNDGAFSEIYERYRNPLYTHALKMLKDREAAKDVIQELFTKLWDRRENLSLKGSLSVYLYTAVRNNILDIFSHEKIIHKYQESLQLFIERGEFVTDNVIREKELSLIIESEIANLPPKMRAVFELSRNANLSYAEIAEELDIAENTVRKHITKAIKKLKEKFNNYLIVIVITAMAAFYFF